MQFFKLWAFRRVLRNITWTRNWCSTLAMLKFVRADATGTRRTSTLMRRPAFTHHTACIVQVFVRTATGVRSEHTGASSRIFGAMTLSAWPVRVGQLIRLKYIFHES